MEIVAKTLISILLICSASVFTMADSSSVLLEVTDSSQIINANVEPVEEEHFLAEHGISEEVFNTVLIILGIGGVFGLVALAWGLSDRHKHPKLKPKKGGYKTR